MPLKHPKSSARRLEGPRIQPSRRARGVTVFLLSALSIGYFIPLMVGLGYTFWSERQHQNELMEAFRNTSVESLSRIVSDHLVAFAPNAAQDAAQFVFQDDRVLSVVVHSTIYDMDFVDLTKRPFPAGAEPITSKKELFASGERIGSVEITIDKKVFTASLTVAYLKILLLFGSMFIGGLALVVPAIYSRVLKPLARLRAQAEGLSSGDFKNSSSWPGSDELSELGRTLEGLRTKLLDSFTRIRDLATKDDLTGLANRRAFVAEAERMVQVGHRYGTPVCLIMLDIDYFKRINDTLGHGAGDAVLREFAAAVEGMIRRSDLFARVGGEEFTLCMPETRLPEAVIVAEKIRSGLESRVFPYDLRVTASLGLTELREGQTLDGLYEAADRALYGAKRLGRNRVETAE